MQPLRFTQKLKSIVEELKVRDVLEFLKRYFTGGMPNVQIAAQDRGLLSKLLIDSRTGFAELSRDPRAANILRLMDIDRTFDQTRLGRLITAFGSAPNMSQIYSTPVYAEFVEFQQSLQALSNLETTCTYLLEVERIGTLGETETILELQLIDLDGKGLSPRRLIEMAERVTRLHANFARTLGVSGDELRIAYLESGSDDIFGFRAAKEILELIKNLIFEVWEKVKYSRFEEFGKKTEALGVGLGAMALVEAAVQGGVVPREEGNIIKAQLLKDVESLIGIGASLPVNQDPILVDQRQLLSEKRNEKLIGPGNTPVGKREDNSTPGDQE